MQPADQAGMALMKWDALRGLLVSAVWMIHRPPSQLPVCSSPAGGSS